MRKDHYEIAGADRDWVERVGWRSVGDVLACSAGGVAAVSRSSDVVEVPIDPALGGPTNVFVKRYRYDRLEQRLKQAMRGTLLGISRGRREFEFLNEMRRRQVPTVRPIACGDRYGLAFLRASFLITEGVTGYQSLDLFAIQTLRRKPMPRAQRQALIEALAATIRQMHEAGVRHGGLFWRNILIRVDADGTFSFLMIDPDTHGRFTDARIPEADAVADLGEVVASAIGLGVRAGLKPFMKAYFQVPRLTADHRRLVAKILTVARELAPSERRRMAITDVIGWLRERTAAVESGRRTVRSFDSLEAFFSEVTARSDADAPRAASGKVIRFSFSGADAANDRTITLHDGCAVVSAALPAKADLKIRTDPKTLLAVVSNHADSYAMLRAGRLRIEGDPAVLCALIEHVDRGRSTAPSSQALSDNDPTVPMIHAETTT